MTYSRITLLAALCLWGHGAALAAPDDVRDKALKARSVKEVFTVLGVADKPEPGNRVLLEVPDIVDGGRNVPVKVTSRIAGTDWIVVLVDRNLTPYVSDQEFSPGQDRSVELKVDLAQTSRVRVVVRAGGKFYQVAREVKVATEGCDDK